MKKYLLLLPLFYIPITLKAQTDSVTAKINKIPFKHVDALAKFTQGDFKTYISQNLQYNHKIEKSIKGQVVLLAGIGADGSISHITILKSLSPLIDQEVVKVINSSPKWQPAVLNGQKVSMDMVFNIDIAINGSKSIAAAKPPVKQTAVVTKPEPAFIIAPSKPIAPKKLVAPIVKKPSIPVIKKPITPAIKKAAPPIAKKIVPPVIKKSPPPIAKRVSPPIVKKVLPPVAKRIEPPVVKKIVPPVAKKVEPPIAKKTIPPIVKKAIPPVAKKVVPPVIKKPAPPIVKKVEPAKKPQPIIAKKTEPLIAKKTEPKAIRKPKRTTVRGNLFSDDSNMPVFPGGLPAFFKYLSENIVYPAGSKKANVEGNVRLTFIIEEDGSVSDVEILSSPAEDLGQEAIRVLLASPKWKPGIQNGRPVPVSYQIPIKFTIVDKQTN